MKRFRLWLVIVAIIGVALPVATTRVDSHAARVGGEAQSKGPSRDGSQAAFHLAYSHTSNPCNGRAARTFEVRYWQSHDRWRMDEVDGNRVIATHAFDGTSASLADYAADPEGGAVTTRTPTPASAGSPPLPYRPLFLADERDFIVATFAAAGTEVIAGRRATVYAKTEQVAVGRSCAAAAGVEDELDATARVSYALDEATRIPLAYRRTLEGPTPVPLMEVVASRFEWGAPSSPSFYRV